MGMQFPAIAKTMQAYWLDSHRGPGGRRQGDLTRTVQTFLASQPNAGLQYLLGYLDSERLEDDFHHRFAPTAHIENVEVDKLAGLVTYTDRTRNTKKITFASLKRMIRRLRPG